MLHALANSSAILLAALGGASAAACSSVIGIHLLQPGKSTVGRRSARRVEGNPTWGKQELDSALAEVQKESPQFANTYVSHCAGQRRHEIVAVRTRICKLKEQQQSWLPA
jgi:hypothetical protein